MPIVATFDVIFQTLPILFLIGAFVYLTVSIVFIVTDNRDPASTLAWILVIFFIPLLGLFLYVFFGRNWRVSNPRKKKKLRFLYKKLDEALLYEQELEAKRLEVFRKTREDACSEHTFSLVRKGTAQGAFLTVSDSVRVFQEGKEKFASLARDIRRAKQFIHLEYFIWRSDPLTEKIVDILIERAKAGVEVRVMIDPFGGLRIRRSDVRRMRAGGIDLRFFWNSFAPLSLTTINYLMHRKIVVIDGTIGYVGGMNMGQEYADGGKRFALWRDTHLRVTGEVVRALESAFAENWYQVTKQSRIFDARYFPESKKEASGVWTQIATSGPNSQWDLTRAIYFSLITRAKRSVWIQTPYFIPDASTYEALRASALSGVDVRVMIPGREAIDKRMPHWGAFTYMPELLSAGVKFYHYNKGFLHAKTITVDDKVCSIGTTNLDIRSFHLSHEISVILYDESLSRQIRRDFEKDMRDSREFTLKDYARFGKMTRFRNSLVRLFSPLM